MKDALVVVLAGRRIDAEQTSQPRFPAENVAFVQQRLDSFFASHKVAALVCSGACGADLLALESAQKHDVFCCLVLPFELSIFKAKSVLDRPGNWGKRFDHVYQHLIEHPAKGNIVYLHYAEDDLHAYDRTNQEIIRNARVLGQLIDSPLNLSGISLMNNLLALIIWDGKVKLNRDATNSFALIARSYNIPLEEISTLS